MFNKLPKAVELINKIEQNSICVISPGKTSPFSLIAFLSFRVLVFFADWQLQNYVVGYNMSQIFILNQNTI